MDEAAYRAARSAAAPQPCVFEKAMLARCAACELALRHALAEREAVGCASPTARINCATVAALLRERSAFALKLAPDAPLPHAVAMKLQCGGLKAILAVGGDTDVHRALAAAQSRHGSLSDLPWPEIVASIVAWQNRRRAGAPR
ncbi:MAG: hypothetical protein ACM3QY_10895 [Candidatus Levyibacteriota bacterium]